MKVAQTDNNIMLYLGGFCFSRLRYWLKALGCVVERLSDATIITSDGNKVIAMLCTCH